MREIDAEAFAVIQRVLHPPKGAHNYGEVPWDMQKVGFIERQKTLVKLRWKPYLVWAIAVASCAGGYMQWGNYAANSYINYAQASPFRWSHLPDMFLDMIPKPPEDNWKTVVGDVLPYLGCVVGVPYLAVMDYFVVLCTAAHIWASHWVLNGIAENTTTLPSSFGYERCLKKSGIEHGDDHTYAVANTTGSCAAMMWSGHTFTVILCLWSVTLGLEDQFPALFSKRLNIGKWISISPRAFLLYGVTAFEMLIILIDHGHYTVDLYIACLLGWFIFSNDRMLFYFYYMNPFVGEIPYERNAVYKELCLRKIAFLCAHEGGLASFSVVDESTQESSSPDSIKQLPEGAKAKPTEDLSAKASPGKASGGPGAQSGSTVPAGGSCSNTASGKDNADTSGSIATSGPTVDPTVLDSGAVKLEVEDPVSGTTMATGTAITCGAAIAGQSTTRRVIFNPWRRADREMANFWT
ncbi:unnamed protein product [Amoebophrya sp. A25]|nr:unnamed protein product [Amoebophrya sp. A25]|eukprot:GSA25T00006236001.1